MDSLQLYAPIAGLWVALAMIIAQIYFATALWPQTPIKPKVERVRWIETRGCMAEIDYKVDEGVVRREYMGKVYPYEISEPYLEVLFPPGSACDVACFPRRMFTLARDGVLEYRY